MRAGRALELARLAYAYHVTPAQLRACTNRELVAMRKHLAEVDRAMKKKSR